MLTSLDPEAQKAVLTRTCFRNPGPPLNGQLKNVPNQGLPASSTDRMTGTQPVHPPRLSWRDRFATSMGPIHLRTPLPRWLRRAYPPPAEPCSHCLHPFNVLHAAHAVHIAARDHAFRSPIVESRVTPRQPKSSNNSCWMIYTIPYANNHICRPVFAGVERCAPSKPARPSTGTVYSAPGASRFSSPKGVAVGGPKSWGLHVARTPGAAQTAMSGYAATCPGRSIGALRGGVPVEGRCMR